MEAKQVPWWRKALDFALSGFRSGFGLFSRAQKQENLTEPETVAGHEEIRKEEAALTEQFPEQDPTVEAESQVVAIAEPEIDLDAEVAAEPEVTTQYVPEAELQLIEEPVLEPEVQMQTQEEAAKSRDFFDEIRNDEPLPAVSVEQHEIMKKDEASEEAVAVPESTTSEIANCEETIVEPESETTVEAAAKTEFAMNTEQDPVAEAELETTLENEVQEVQESAEAPVKPDLEPEHVSAETVPEAEEMNDFFAPVEKDAIRQVAEQQVTFNDVPVDEPAPQAEAAISEASAPEQASPVPDEMIVPVEQAPGEEIAEPAAELIVGQAVDQIDEQTTHRNADAGRSIEVDQAIAKPMELNRPNSEPAAEQEQTTEAAPIAGEENVVAAPEASVLEPATVDEPEAPATVLVAAQQPSRPFIKLEAKEGEANASPFSVIVSQVYDGPLDLLLDLIRKQDIDIYDIPIARITAQFLAYVDQLKATDVDVAGDFIYTASLLIHIKSKMLLPRAPAGQDDTSEDPRRELVERLLEHERFKNAAQMLQQKQMLEAASWTNPGMREFKEDAGAEPEIAADTVDLVRVFQDILERTRNRPILDVEEDAVTVGQMIQFLSRRLTMEDKPVALRRLLSHTRSERALIAMFLALLELVRLQAILLRQDRAFCEIFIKKHANFESVMNEGVSHDDWK